MCVIIFWLPLFNISQLTVHCTLYILSTDIFKYQLNAEAVMQWVRAFVLQPEGWVFEFQPQQT